MLQYEQHQLLLKWTPDWTTKPNLSDQIASTFFCYIRVPILTLKVQTIYHRTFLRCL